MALNKLKKNLCVSDWMSTKFFQCLQNLELYNLKSKESIFCYMQKQIIIKKILHNNFTYS